MDSAELLAQTCNGAAGVVALCILGALVQLVRAPSQVDRIVCIDMISFFTVALIALFVLMTGHAAFLDAAITLGLVAFVATIALARYAEGEARK